jgi:two-component system, NarL family, nitrate/nitrite response regulator NarL
MANAQAQHRPAHSAGSREAGATPSPIRVLLADDHPILLASLRALLERHGYAVVGTATSGEETITLAASCCPRVVVMDVEMPGLGGLAAIPHVRKAAPSAQVLMLSAHSEESDVIEALSGAGAAGYLVKHDALGELLNAITAVASGKRYTSSSIAAILLRHIRFPPHGSSARELSTLTRREREVLRLTAQGARAKAIAASLSMSPKTAQVHSENIRRKLQLHSTAELVRYAIEQRIVKLD